MLGIYTLVFGTIFNIRWNSLNVSKLELATILFSGLLILQFFSESIIQAPTLIQQHTSYVKKVVFPLYILPIIAVGGILTHTLIGLAILLLLLLLANGELQATAPLIIFVLIPTTFLTLGFSWLLASVGVYVKDITHTVGIITSMLLFMSPIFYPIEAIPEEFKFFIYLNPLTFLIEQARNVLIWGESLDWSMLAIYTVVSAIFALICKNIFEKMKNGFADVL